MPHSDLHERKKAKNYAVLAAIFGLIILLFALSIIKMDQGW